LCAKDGYTQHGDFGAEPTELGDRIKLEEGMTLYFPADEWHVIEYDEDGFVDIIFFYSDPSVYTKQIKDE